MSFSLKDWQSQKLDKKDLEEVYQCNSFSDIGKCFAKMHLEFNASLNFVAGEVTELKERMDKVEVNHRNTVENCEKMKQYFEGKINSYESQLQALAERHTKLDLWGRKWNLVIKGIPGPLNEDTYRTEKVTKQFMVDNLKIRETAVAKMNFSAAHRLPGGIDGKKNIIVRFNSLKDRDLVLNSAKNLKDQKGLSIMTDLPPELSKRRSELLKKRYQMPIEERRQFQLKQLKEAPFITLVKRSNNSRD